VEGEIYLQGVNLCRIIWVLSRLTF